MSWKKWVFAPRAGHAKEELATAGRIFDEYMKHVAVLTPVRCEENGIRPSLDLSPGSVTRTLFEVHAGALAHVLSKFVV